MASVWKLGSRGFRQAIGLTAEGIGWGNFKIQRTLSESFPTRRISKIGDSTIWNLALQAPFGEMFWLGGSK
jgi:hypothetical protein